jgi:starch phosphorylase
MIFKDITNPVVYLSSEFAIDNDLPTYAGGLGILAGDYINEAAQEQFQMIGIGILYKGKDFLQHITQDGKAQTRDSEFDHDVSFLRPTTVNGLPLIFTLDVGDVKVEVKSYHTRLSDTSVLFFLSTDVDGNPPEWVADMDTLYRGDTDSQIRQQILLGVGGVKLIDKLGLKPRFYHINEGRPEFIIWELCKNIMQNEGKTFENAWRTAQETIIYTNHTLVSAGNMAYPKDNIKYWATSFAKEMKVDNDALVKDGITGSGSFSTTLFALNISKRQNAVSKVHGDYAKKEWPNYNWISITNGVNLFRWQDSDFRRSTQTDFDIWKLHQLKKRELVKTVIERTGYGYNPERLVIAWARRLAEYKQPRAIFSDIKKLKDIISQQDRTVQILYAGNSHSSDPNAKSIIEEIIQIFSRELSGYAIFVPNYNMSLANNLTSGVDVWLNTPKGNLEACGTSGMKAISNGVLNCTVLDGWTYEADWTDIGWVLDPNNVGDSFYTILKEQIIPTFYNRNSDNLPEEWIQKMRKSIKLANQFSTERMLKEYSEKIYK